MIHTTTNITQTPRHTQTHNSKKGKAKKSKVACCVADHIRDKGRKGRVCIRTNRFEVGLRCVVQLLQGDSLGLCFVGQGVVVLVHAALLRLAHLLSGPLLLREGEQVATITIDRSGTRMFMRTI